jgi:hypothetical protein
MDVGKMRHILNNAQDTAIRRILIDTATKEQQGCELSSRVDHAAC